MRGFGRAAGLGEIAGGKMMGLVTPVGQETCWISHLSPNRFSVVTVLVTPRQQKTYWISHLSPMSPVFGAYHKWLWVRALRKRVRALRKGVRALRRGCGVTREFWIDFVVTLVT